METDGSQELCTSCRQLDIDKLFSDIEAKSVALENNPSCSFCRFIANHHTAHRDYTQTNDIYFTIFPQKARGALDLHRDIDDDRPDEAYYLRVTWPLKNNKGCLSTTPGTFLALASDDSSPPKPHLNQRLIPPRVDYELLQSWLSKCRRDHIACNPPDLASDLPSDRFKLIDVYSGTVGSAPREVPYVCLSYVWGETSRICLSPEAQMPGVLPKTIADAISVTRELGFRYLWIDAFCIDQTDPEEVALQIKSMSKVYSQASLTIVSLSNSNADEGLPGVSADHPAGRYQTSTLLHGRRIILSDIIGTTKPFVRSAWNQRGWTMQEGLFSSHCLCFSEFETFLWCKNHVFRESIAESSTPFRALPPHHQWGRPKPPMQISIDGKWDFDTYAKLVNIYRARQLSFETDALNAFSGTIAHFEKISGIRFRFGLPENTFITALLWAPPRQGKRRNLPRTLVPSWSWASWSNAEYYYEVFHTEQGDIKAAYRYNQREPTIVKQLSMAKIIFPAVHDPLQHVITVEAPIARFRLQRHSLNLDKEEKRQGIAWSLHSQQGQLVPARLGYRDFDSNLKQFPDEVQEELLEGDVEVVLIVRWKGLEVNDRKGDHDDDFVFGLIIRRLGDVAERIELLQIEGAQWDEAEKSPGRVRLT